MKTLYSIVVLCLSLFAFLPSLFAAELPLTIQVASLSATWVPDSKLMTLSCSGNMFFRNMHSTFAQGTAHKETVNDNTFGAGQVIVVRDNNGHQLAIALFEGVPFALMRASFKNLGKETVDLNKIPVLSGEADFDVPSDKLAALGTGGLSHPGKRQGSYMWQAVADPTTRGGLAAGWITSERGSGTIFCERSGGGVQLGAQLEHGHLRVNPDATVDLETLAIGYFDDVRLGLEKYADTIAKIYSIKLPPQPSGYCTWYHAGSSNERDIVRQAEIAQRELVPFGFNFLQIDDGWQDGESHNGPKRNFTRARPDGPYRGGMKATADMIAAHGMTPGIWFMPFAGTSYDPWFKDRQDLFVHDKSGKPYETAWGGTCLDMTNPATRKYVQDYVREIAKDWHFSFFKMDGLWTGTATKQQYVNLGYRDDGIGDAVLHDPDMTNIEAYRSGLKLLRETAGRDVFLLGCCASQNMRSYGGAFGLLDAMRVGPDNSGGNWDKVLTGPRIASRHYFLNGRVWFNDPDVTYVRSSLTLDQARANCAWSALSGQLFMVSDDFRKLPAERLDVLKRMMPAHGQLARPVDLLDEEVPKIWMVSSHKNGNERHVLGLFNWGDKPWEVDLPLKRLGLNDTIEDKKGDYAAFDFWGNAFLPSVKERLKITVPPTSCKIVALRAETDHPQVISSSRHITQGMVDVLDEHWDEATHSLQGRSMVVRDDIYQLRISLGTKYVHSRVMQVQLKGTDNFNPTIENSPGVVRVTIEPSHSREIGWKIDFTQEK